MPTYRVKAMVNGSLRRSWGMSDSEEQSRTEAQAQLDAIFGPGVGEVVSVEEVSEMQAIAEELLSYHEGLKENEP